MRPLKTRPCTRSDINFEGKADSTARFFKPAEISVADVERFYDKLLCIEEIFELAGNFNTAKAKQLFMSFEVCKDPEGTTTPKCKDLETFIKPWMRRKFLFTLDNEYEFQKSKIEDETIHKYSSLHWYVLSP